jgi:putative SbcD/Mre11-related phosphoesterase
MRVARDWMLTPWRAAVHLPSRTAVVADLHLGYAEARRRDGDSVPLVSVADALAPLQSVLDVPDVQRLVVAGDLFEDGPLPELAAALLAWLRARDVELVAVVPGNHDRGVQGLSGLPIRVGGFDLDSWHIVHGDGERPIGPVIQGHEHPLLRWDNGLSAPCYLVRDDHIVLPAFSADAAGVNVLHDRRWWAHRCCAIAGERVLDFGELAALRPAGRATGATKR